MTPEVFQVVKERLVEVSPYVKVLVLYHGGEPLLNPRLSQMVRDCRSVLHLEKLKIVTNGMLLDLDCSQDLIDAGVTDFEISIDGNSKEENERIRIGADTDKIFSNLANLIQLIEGTNVEVKISNTQIREAEGLTSQENVESDWIRERLLRSTGWQSATKVVPAIRWPSMGDRGVLDVAPLKGKPLSGMVCDHTINTFTIRFDGKVVPCCYDLMTDLPMGNIIESSLLEIWKGYSYQNLRSSIHRGEPPKPCDTCAVLVGGQQLRWKSEAVSVDLGRPRRSELRHIELLKAPNPTTNVTQSAIDLE